MGAPVNEETVGHLRQRLNVMRDIVKVSENYVKYMMRMRSSRLNVMRDIVKVKMHDHGNDNDMS